MKPISLEKKKALDYLEFVYLPELIRKRKGKTQQLKIWSAGCATGEEPYSIAILLQRIIPDIQNWDITIFASDINSTFINKAKKGVYSQWSFRQTSESFKEKYFNKLDKNHYQIKDSIKKMVSFSFLNLATDIYLPQKNISNKFDVILCRNVLIYFSSEGIRSVASKFYKSLKKQGILLVSPVETSSLLSSEFGNVSYRGYTIFKKGIDNKTEITKKTERNKYSKQLNEYQQSIEIQHKYPSKQISQFQSVSKEKIVSPLNLTKKEEIKVTAVCTNNYEDALKLYNSGLLDEAKDLLINLIANKDKMENSSMLLLAKIYANKGQ